MSISVCRSCGTRITWVKTKNGKNMPVDYDKDFDDVGGCEVQEFDSDRMVSHFATCPNANEHRRKL